MNKENKLFLGLTIIIITVILFMAYLNYEEDSDQEPQLASMAESIGGGSGFVEANPGFAYCDSSGFETVNTRESLVSALESASEGDTVFIEGDTEIDMTGEDELGVPEGVSVVSNRGCGNSEGALLFKNDAEKDQGIFGTRGDNVTISGLKLEGFGTSSEPHSRDKTRAAGINVHHSSAEIYNNVVDNFVGRCIVGAGDNLHIHHNEISYCNQYGYGYGVAVHESNALIEANHFKHYRHAISGSGSSTVYEARYNIFGPGRTNTDVDMHGTVDTRCSSQSGGDAGTSQHIHQNTFVAGETYSGSGHSYIKIRGEPIETSVIEHNWFKGDLKHRTVEERAIEQSKPEEGECNIWMGAEPEDYYGIQIRENHYKQSEPSECIIGAPRERCQKD